jgi:hypothetical protein
MSGKLRPFVIAITVTAAERDELLSAAEKNAMSAASYVRARALAMTRREARMDRRIDQRLGISETESA